MDISLPWNCVILIQDIKSMIDLLNISFSFFPCLVNATFHWNKSKILYLRKKKVVKMKSRRDCNSSLEFFRIELEFFFSSRVDPKNNRAWKVCSSSARAVYESSSNRLRVFELNKLFLIFRIIWFLLNLSKLSNLSNFLIFFKLSGTYRA